MREIKFRAWDKLHKKMLTKIDVMHFDSSESGVEQVYGYNPSKEATSDADWVALSRLVVMQYTGLKDKNGKEIYEEDILKSKWKEIAVVRWDEEDLVYHPISNIIRGNRNWDDRENFEVIGNIYFNPELLANPSERE